MMIQTNTTDRKALVKAIATELHTEARYLRTPTYAYQIGDFTVDRDGNIIGDDFTPLLDFLLANGYITEEPEAATEVEDAEADADALVESTETERAEDVDTDVPVEVTEDTTEDADADVLVEAIETEPAEDAADDANEDTTENAAAPVEVTETEPTEDTVDVADDAEADELVEATEVEPAEDATEDDDAQGEDNEAEPTEDAVEDDDVQVEDNEAELTVDDIEAVAEDDAKDVANDADTNEPVEAADEESTEAIAEDDAAGLEAQVEATDEEPADEADTDDDSDEEQQRADTTADATTDTPSETAAPADDSDPDTQTITIPAPGITAAQLRNLTFILYSRQYILNLMTGDETIQIPDALVQSLKNTLPDNPERFSDFLEIYRQVGLRGFDFKDGQFSMTFPFCENEPAKWTTFAELQGRILQAAMTAKRVAPDLIQPEEEAEKYTAHIWLQRLGYKGAEMKEQRNILLHHLHGYCAFSNGEKMQNHKDKYGAIRRERREAERAAVQAIVETVVPASTAPETIPPETAAPASTEPEATEPTTTEASPSVVVLAKEVVTNE